jgi:DNA modification methylase
VISLHLGDCLDVLRSLPSGSVDAVITDPPYGVRFQGKNTKHTRRKGDGYASLLDDEEYVRSLVVPVIELCIEKFSRVIVTPGVRMMHMYPRADEIGGVYCPSGAGIGRWGFVCFHPILYYGKCPYTQRSMGSRPNSFSSTESSEKNGHPCPKPIGWMRWLVNRASLPGMTVLDPFSGSGTTGVACIESGRQFIGIEIDPGYHAIAERRINAAQAKLSLFDGVAPCPTSAAGSATS